MSNIYSVYPCLFHYVICSKLTSMPNKNGIRNLIPSAIFFIFSGTGLEPVKDTAKMAVPL